MIVFILCLDISIFVVIWWSYIILCSCDYSLFVYPWVNITGTGDEMHYLTQCQNSVISRTRVELLEPFHKKWKGIHKLTQIELTNAILASENDDMFLETELLCLKIQEAFEKEAL